MKQYCRYCANANLVEDDICYCDIKQRLRNKVACTAANECKNFEFNEIDVFDMKKTYKPQAIKPQEKNPWEQVEM